MEKIKKQLLSFGKIEANTLIVFVFLSVLTLSALFWQNNIFIFASAFLISLFFIWQTPEAGLWAIFLTTAIFGEHFTLLPIQFEDAIYKLYALDIALIITFICWLLQKKSEPINLKIKKINWHSPSTWLLIFSAFILLTLFRSLITASDKILALGTFKNYIYLLIYFFIIAIIKNREQIFRFIKTLLASGIILIGFAIYGWINGAGLWSEVTPGLRYLSGLHAYFLTFSAITLFILLTYKKYILNKIKLASIFLIQLAGIIGSMFRHLWLGIACAFTFIFFNSSFSHKKNLIKFTLGVLLIIIISSILYLWLAGIFNLESESILSNQYFSSVVGRSKTILNTGETAESATGWRLATWQIALQKLNSNPFLGIGFGQKFYFEYRGWLDLIDIRNIHNDFASLLVQLGLLGWIPFIFFNIFILKNLYTLIQTTRHKNLKDLILKNTDLENTKILTLMLSGFYIVTLFGIFFGIYLMFNGTSIFYWTICGLIMVLNKSNC